LKSPASFRPKSGSAPALNTPAPPGGNGNQPVNEGRIYVRLKERKTREHLFVIQPKLRERFKRFPGIRAAVNYSDETQADARPIQATLRGLDWPRMVPLGERLKGIVETTPGATDVDTSEEVPRPGVRVNVNRKLAGDLGVDLGTVASTVRGLVAGEVGSQVEDPDGDSYDVRLRVDSSCRTQRGDLLGLDLPGHSGRDLIPLGQVAQLEAGTAPSSIRRRDLMREIRISANTQGRSLAEVVNQIKQRGESLHLPAGINLSFTGESEDMIESFGYALQSLVLAVILIYSILASQFRSFLQPFAIMLSLPLSLVGVAGMLYLVRDTLNLMSMIGLILLMGLVTKNAILVVDFAKVQRRAGASRSEAVIAASRVRLRPILMTTRAMIFGMLPLAFEIGAGAEFRAPMARAVIGGLITSTLLTLIVVPVVYTYLDDFGERFERWWSRKTPEHRRTATRVEEVA